ncbi:hypothetical protein [Bacillus suaedae]|uniref:Uncharacterized protein n=1 Tax=Halalkalibacter suaedae TaxID=2822140 RepID=A0A940WX61_9BACI|nr:hypothetical protein [Bacillus suaedae]MBP3949860.1 hypothetical protein [Bacillus suaedae]
MSIIIFAFSIFCGWLIFDVVKHRKLNIKMILSSFVISVIAGVAWWLLDLIL